MPHEKCVRISHRRCGQSANEGESGCITEGEARRPDERADASGWQSATTRSAFGPYDFVTHYTEDGCYISQRFTRASGALIESKRELVFWPRHSHEQPRQSDA